MICLTEGREEVMGVAIIQMPRVLFNPDVICGCGYVDILVPIDTIMMLCDLVRNNRVLAVQYTRRH